MEDKIKNKTDTWLESVLLKENEHQNHELSMKNSLEKNKIPFEGEISKPVSTSELLGKALERADQFHQIILPAVEEMAYAVREDADAEKGKALANMIMAGQKCLQTYADIYTKFVEVEGRLESEKLKAEAIKSVKIGDTINIQQNNVSVTTPAELMRKITEAMSSGTFDVDKLKMLKEQKRKLDRVTNNSDKDNDINIEIQKDV